MAMESFVGRKTKKAWRMKPKARAGRPATGEGEWRLLRKTKVKTEPVKKEKKEKGKRGQ